MQTSCGPGSNARVDLWPDGSFAGPSPWRQRHVSERAVKGALGRERCAFLPAPLAPDGSRKPQHSHQPARRGSLEELRPEILLNVNDGAYQNVISFPGIRNIMRLVPVAAKAGAKLIGRKAYAREIGEKGECVIEAGKIGFGLVRAEFSLAMLVYSEKVFCCPVSKFVLSRGAAWSVCAPRRGCPPLWPR